MSSVCANLNAQMFSNLREILDRFNGTFIYYLVTINYSQTCTTVNQINTIYVKWFYST